MADRTDLVRQVKDALPFDSNDPASIFSVTRRVAWALRGEGCGLLIKTAGENIVTYHGEPFSVSRVCYPDGQLWKILADVGPNGANRPQWADDGTVPIDRYRPAIEPEEFQAHVPAPSPDAPDAPDAAPPGASADGKDLGELADIGMGLLTVGGELLAAINRVLAKVEELQRDGIGVRLRR